MPKRESSTGHEHDLVPVKVYCAEHTDTVLVCMKCVMRERGRAGGRKSGTKERTPAQLAAALKGAHAPRPAKYKPRKAEG